MAVIPDPATTNWVPIWNPVSTGPIGPPGPIGPTGPQGPSGSSANVLKYRADTASQSMSTDPGNGKMRWNNATQNLSTVLSFDRVTDEGFDATLILQLTATEDNFAIQDQDLAANNQVWKQTGPAVIIGADWFNVPVQFVSGNTSFTNLERLAILVKNKGATGPIGPAGPQGPAGPTGPQGPAGSAAAHHTQHEPGGTDYLLNSVWTNLPNTFTKKQTLQTAGQQPNLFLINTDGTVDIRAWNILAAPTGVLAFSTANDAGVTQFSSLTLQRDGVSITGYLAVLGTPGNITVSGTMTAAGLGTTPLNGTQITSGTIPDARLSSNVALKNINNSFVAQTLASGSEIRGGNSLLGFIDTAGPVDYKNFRFVSYSDGNLHVESLNDANSVVQGRTTFYRVGGIQTSGNVFISGNITEFGRATPLGHWIDVPFTAGYFAGSGGGTWTVGAPAVIKNRYTLIGKTMIWSVYISWFSGSNVIAGVVNALYFYIPAGFTVGAGNSGNALAFSTNADVPTEMWAISQSNAIIVQRKDSGNFTVGSAPGIIATFTFEIA